MSPSNQVKKRQDNIFMRSRSDDSSGDARGSETGTKIDREFGEKLLRVLDDPKYSVHQMFHDFWKYAPDEVKEKYLHDFEAIPEQREFGEQAWMAPRLEMENLERMPEGSLGRTYHQWIVDNDLVLDLPSQYQESFEHMKAKGLLDDMPEAVRYGVLRTFQTHDLLHVVTGIGSTGEDEIKLQAFCLAQIRFAYFGMHLLRQTGRMTLLDPDLIVPMMDVIADGWRFGRSVRNVFFERWENRLEESLAALRVEFGIDPAGGRPLTPAG